MKQGCNKGFTLLELSIVLVIIGLISGAILMGKDLIRAALVRETAQQIDMLDKGILAFRLKFGCIPGDCTNATSLGFHGDTFIISRNNIPENNSLFAYLNPISDANAFSLQEMISAVAAAACYNNSLSVSGLDTNNCQNSGQQIITMVADGNGNGSIDITNNEHFAVTSLLEQAHFIAPYNVELGLMPLKNREMYSPVTNQRAVFVIGSVTPFENLTLARTPAITYFISGTATTGINGTSATAATPVYIAKALDFIVDNGRALDGRLTASVNQRLTQYGLFYLASQTVNSSIGNFDCLGLNQAGEADYNLLNGDKPFCSVQITSAANY